jgi:hypothetical protein
MKASENNVNDHRDLQTIEDGEDGEFSDAAVCIIVSGATDRMLTPA